MHTTYRMPSAITKLATDGRRIVMANGTHLRDTDGHGIYAHSKNTNCLAFMGNIPVSGGEDDLLASWDENMGVKNARSLNKPITSLCCSDDSVVVIAGGEVTVLGNTLLKKSSFPTEYERCAFGGENLVLWGGRNNNVIIVNTSGKIIAGTLWSSLSDVAACHGDNFAILGNDNICVYHLNKNRIIIDRVLPCAADRVEYSRDGSRLLASSEDKLYVFDTDTWQRQEMNAKNSLSCFYGVNTVLYADGSTLMSQSLLTKKEDKDMIVEALRRCTLRDGVWVFEKG